MEQEARDEQAGPAHAALAVGSEQPSPSGETRCLQGDQSADAAQRSSEAGVVQSGEEPSETEQPEDGAPEAPVNLMPSVALLSAHIQHHMAGGPGCNPEVAGTFTPLVSMAYQLHLQAQAAAVPHEAAAQAHAAAIAAMSLPGHIPGLQGGDSVMQAYLGMPAMGAAAALALAPPAFDPSVLAAPAIDATAAAAEAAAAGAAAAAVQQPTEEQQGAPARTSPASAAARKSGGRRRQQGGRGGASQEGDALWQQPVQDKRSAASRQGGGMQRPQRERKRSRLLEEYVDDEGLDAAGLGGG